MAQDTTTTALRKAGDVTDAQIAAAVEAMMKGDERTDYPIADGWTLDIPKALDAHKPRREAMSSDNAAFKWNMAKTAVLVAKLDKA